jgi:glycerol-3-phosphate dehydrogenase
VKRENVLSKLDSQEVWDVIIIGGGASGLGTAIESVTRGYKTLLLEQHDFTKGTSSRSTKLVHGGVRYLSQGNIPLVFEALRERGFLKKNAPHLVSNLSFLIPSYSWWSIPFYTIGLTVYDLLAWRLSFGRSKPQTRSKTIAHIPTINKTNLKGSVLYHDGQFDDSRLGINMAQTILEKGGVALNYMKVTSFQKTEKKINAIICKDQETGKEYTIHGNTVVNATGVFVNSILQKDNPNTKDVVTVSQGVHLVIDREFLPSSYGLMIPKTKDGRVLFAVPWHNKVILGTTDIEKEVSSLEPEATDEEIDFILETAGRFLSKKPTRKDVKSVFAGLRPLAAPQDENESTKEISRGHKIHTSRSGLITIIGGKWTTYRQMGEDVIDTMEREKSIQKTHSKTESLRLYGYQENVNFSDPLYFYGSDTKKINALIKSDNSLKEWISEELKINKAQVIWAFRHEMARTVEDVLARRTRALFLNAKESIRIAPKVAEILAQEYKYDTDWEIQQVELFNNVAEKYLLK